jgi:hypothetical protein
LPIVVNPEQVAIPFGNAAAGPDERTTRPVNMPAPYRMVDATPFHDYYFNVLTSHQYHRWWRGGKSPRT